MRADGSSHGLDRAQVRGHAALHDIDLQTGQTGTPYRHSKVKGKQSFACSWQPLLCYGAQTQARIRSRPLVLDANAQLVERTLEASSYVATEKARTFMGKTGLAAPASLEGSIFEPVWNHFRTRGAFIAFSVSTQIRDPRKTAGVTVGGTRGTNAQATRNSGYIEIPSPHF